MAVTAFWYGLAFTSTFNKEADWNSDTVKCGLTTSSYTENQDTHDYYNDITNELTTTGGYTATGTTISPLSFVYTGGSNLWQINGSNAAWTTATFTANKAFVYDSTPGTSATDPLLMYVLFGGDQTVSSATFTITWNASGIANITPA